MCRILLVNSENCFNIEEKLIKFAEISKNSKEYQGDGWGIGYLKKHKMDFYYNSKPIWMDNLNQFGESNLIMVHARSAFNDYIKPIENNMPFYDKNYCFIFNGELRGVRIKENGRIGAEKIFNFIKRFDKEGLYNAIKKSNKIIQSKSTYIRAMNFIMIEKKKILINSFYNEDSNYFSLYKKEIGSTLMVCSEQFPGESNWEIIENKSLIELNRR